MSLLLLKTLGDKGWGEVQTCTLNHIPIPSGLSWEQSLLMSSQQAHKSATSVHVSSITPVDLCSLRAALPTLLQFLYPSTVLYLSAVTKTLRIMVVKESSFGP